MGSQHSMRFAAKKTLFFELYEKKRVLTLSSDREFPGWVFPCHCWCYQYLQARLPLHLEKVFICSVLKEFTSQTATRCLSLPPS